ncbi:MAG: methylenetetrahydrofolate--tRNA-(uracil(54)-C(5))-methyltransferase (FADH(2)-oxidizing) TrmFO [Rhodobacterales bacterium]|jgi:methylenetetrahydrofolate--tRNA-(uracil-5-)-methyltransferase|tara:strand:+ start:2855 stop:4201 length:1347 start_codon:yes stop_codon:yes gene_type:complete
MNKTLHIIGAGMAGSEAAWQAANQDVNVIIYEMRPKIKTFAHQTENFAEMVCSNSFRSNDSETNAVGLLHWEMKAADGLIIKTAEKYRLPAGGALAVDRILLSEEITTKLKNHPNIKFSNKEVTDLPPSEDGKTIVATGPLTSSKLANAILEVTGQESLAFFDAIAPIIHTDSVDLSKTWYQSRYDKGDTEIEKKAYLNCPMNKQQYDCFINALLEAEYTEFKPGEIDETPYFEGCLPIEVMAQRGHETLRFGPMKPVGLTNPHNPSEKPYAVVQLRQDNKLGTLLNIVGFQTKMKYGSQLEVLKMIPGLENANFARLGGIHRNTFINSPTLLDHEMRLKTHKHIRFAGQITGVEGYVESAAMGLLAARLAINEIKGKKSELPPIETATGSLLNHITKGANKDTFQPMNVNFGLFPPVLGVKNGRRNRKERYQAYTERAKQSWLSWLK